MSMNRENITWQSEDGTWNIGHYDYEETNLFDEDRDPEWDVEYNFDAFHWASTGHATEESAERAWTGCNPGGGTVMRYNADDADVVAATARLNQMVANLREIERQEAEERRKNPVRSWW